MWAAEMAESLNSPFVAAFALSTQSRLEAHLGRVEAARATLARSPHRDDRWHYAAGVLEFALGNQRKADEHFSAVAAELEAHGIREAVRHRFDGDHIDAAVALGDLGRAERMLNRLDERAATLPRPWTMAVAARCRGLLRASRGDLDGAIAALDQALVLHARLEMPFELGRTLLVKGEVHRRRREKRLAKESIESARSLFEELGARLWMERAEGHLARLAPRAGAVGLTATEAEVARLAATGRTNREIAGALFMSPKTVEKRLATVYEKLGIRSRAELGGRMAELTAGRSALKT
jgi:DNA-binding CsgD family transcriptional regulator